jgi:hypothetical protein
MPEAPRFCRSGGGILRLLSLVIAISLTAALLLPLAGAREAEAWSSDSSVNTPVCTAADDQTRPAMVSDGTGGAIVVWQDHRSGTGQKIYAQRMDRYGATLWTDNGVAVCTAAGSQQYPAAISDDAGGVIVTWEDYRSGTSDIYAQRINSAGTRLWTDGGAIVCNYSSYQDRPAIVSDGAGRSIIVWSDYRDGHYDIYAQKIDLTGSRQWDSAGVGICTGGPGSDYFRTASDGMGGAVVTWPDWRGDTGPDIYAQRVSSSGALLWTDNGTAVCSASDAQQYPIIACDGSGGALVAWDDYRDGLDVYVQRLDSEGTALWTENGIALTPSGGYGASVTGDGAGGAIIAWSDIRNSGDSGDIFIQRVNGSGEAQWTAGGVDICSRSGYQVYVSLLPDGSGGASISWRSEPGDWSQFDVCAQHVDSSGTTSWAEGGVAVCTVAGNPDAPYFLANEGTALISDGSGGAILAWEDYRSGDNLDIYAQRVHSSGNLGSPPDQPANVSPVDLATGIGLTPTLQSSAFSDDPGDSHQASRWQITTTAGDYTTPTFDSGIDTSNLTSVAILSGELDVSTTYFWHVRYQDNHGDWSSWSEETSFTTINQPPNQPTNTAPADSTSGVSLTPTLQSSPFSDPDDDVHAASQWQMTATAGDYSNPVFDSLTDSTNLASIAVPAGKLSYSTTYHWHVRHQDNHGDWSGWSAETSFTTENRAPSPPTNISPTDGDTGTILAPILQSTAYSDPDSGDSHIASQWRMTTTSGDYSNPVFDSGLDAVNLAQISVPSGELNGNTTYYWQVRHQDSHGGWSDWSAETSFTTQNQAPDKPAAAYVTIPADIVTLTPILQCSPFSDPDPGDVHAASQWRITATAGDYSTLVLDSSTDNVDLLYIPISSGVLESRTTYYWQVRHQDSHGDWSEWSTEYSFTTQKKPRNWTGVVVGVGAGAAVILAGAIAAWLVLRGKRSPAGQS